ncbi:MAG TPA: hypothetical protein DDZ89_19920 [Clostridiales bacterium]|mgnify:CR=1 FL=1|nr:hypothetical protein [Clostridiales bacterium]
MRKILILLLAFTVLFSFVACNTDTNLEGDLEDILAQIYETAELDDEFRQYVIGRLNTQEIPMENMQYFLGVEGLEFLEAIASEPMISAQAYSLCLVRVKEDADIEAMKTSIKENVNPRKWVCVGVDPENVIVDSIGDVIILIMTNDYAKEFHDAFLALKE